MALELILVAVIVLVLLFPKSRGDVGSLVHSSLELAHEQIVASRPLFWIVVIIAAACFGYIASAELAWLMAMDAAAYVELTVAVAFVNAMLRVRGFWAQMVLSARETLNRSVAPVLRIAQRVREHASRSRVRRPSHDEDASDPAFAFA